MNDEYWRFAESERHFNQIQAGIRNRAATWMLAAFAAIAVLLKTQIDVNWLVSPMVLVGVVSMMATLGLLVLWINDQLVYQRLLDCGFIVGLKREYDDPGLPPIRTMMMYAGKGKGMSRWMTYFYTIPMWSFLVITVAAAVLQKNMGGEDSVRGIELLVLIALCIAQACVAIWVQMKKSEVGIRTRAGLFEDRDFAAMFDEAAHTRARLAEVIGRYCPAGAGREKAEE